MEEEIEEKPKIRRRSSLFKPEESLDESPTTIPVSINTLMQIQEDCEICEKLMLDAQQSFQTTEELLKKTKEPEIDPMYLFSEAEMLEYVTMSKTFCAKVNRIVAEKRNNEESLLEEAEERHKKTKELIHEELIMKLI